MVWKEHKIRLKKIKCSLKKFYFPYNSVLFNVWKKWRRYFIKDCYIRMKRIKHSGIWQAFSVLVGYNLVCIMPLLVTINHKQFTLLKHYITILLILFLIIFHHRPISYRIEFALHSIFLLDFPFTVRWYKI